MKPTLFTAGLASLALSASALADQTINITGSSAFRPAVLSTIKAQYVIGNGGASFQFAHDAAAGSLNSSTQSIFIGKFPNLSGITTIRCCFTGSVEGIRSLVLAPNNDPSPPKYLPSSVATTVASSTGGETAPVATTLSNTAVSDIAFSDVNKTATPFGTATLNTDPAGVIVFTMMTNKGSTITNVTSQQYRALLGQGFQPLSLFTGIAANTSLVFPIGRNDASGTRTTALAEIGYGITNVVNQYVTTATGGGAITQLQLTPAGGSFASTVWGQDQAGNGGYTSGGTVRAPLSLTSASVQVLDETGAEAFPAGPINLLTWLGVSDAGSAKTTGGLLCAYNGVTLDLAGAGNTLSTADIAKVSNGSYTAWGYERMFRRPSPAAEVLSVYNTLKGNFTVANVGTAGVSLSVMKVGRGSDGGVVSPLD